MVEAVKYVGNNTFEGATMKVIFELLPGGDAKVTVKDGEKILLTGKRFSKY